MGTLDDFLAHEATFLEESVGRLGARKNVIDLILSVAHMATQYQTPLADVGTLGMARLLVDAAVAIEQAFLCALRAQPRLGWAAMRIAAEATKDLECIRKEPGLYQLWLAIGSARTTRESTDAQAAFKDARKQVSHNDVTRACQESMRLCSILGSHPNATALGSMGPTPIDDGTSTVTMPVRVTDARALDWHLDQMIKHSTAIVSALASVRMASLSDGDRDDLAKWCLRLNEPERLLIQAADTEIRDDGGDQDSSC